MKSKIGLWIDHRKAIIVILSEKGEEIKEISSGIDEFIKDANTSSDFHSPEDTRDRKQINYLKSYYAEIVEILRAAGGILIMGPGEAKGELEACLGCEGLKDRIAGMETADKMTDRQVAAKVREYFV